MTLLRNNRRDFRRTRSKRASRSANQKNKRSGRAENSYQGVTPSHSTTNSQLDISALPPHQYPSRNGSSSHHAAMSPLEAKSQLRPISSKEQIRNRLIHLISIAGAGAFGIIVSIGTLFQGGTLFPHRIRALFAVLFVVALWSLCAFAAPNLMDPNRPKKRFLRVIIFLLGILLLMAGLQTAKRAIFFVFGGFPILLLLNGLIVAGLHPLIKHHTVRRAVVLFFLSTLLGSLSIAVMHGEWDVGAIILSTGYGALCAAVGLTTDRLAANKRIVSLYSALILGGSLSLPALAILAGLPPRYLVSYLAMVPAIIHLRRVSRDEALPVPYIPLFIAGWFLFSVATLSFFSTALPSDKLRNHQGPTPEAEPYSNDAPAL